MDPSNSAAVHCCIYFQSEEQFILTAFIVKTDSGPAVMMLYYKQINRDNWVNLI